MTRPLIIVGTGGNALDILDIVDAVNADEPTWEVVGVLDDGRAPGTRFENIEVLGAIRDAALFPCRWFVNSIGSDKSFRKRPEILAQLSLAPDQFATLVHPLASVSRRASLGPGTCVNPGVAIAGGVKVGSHVWFGSGCVVGHDATIDDFAVIGPQAVVSGFVRIGEATYLGAGAAIRQRATIGNRSLVGMGAVVVADVAPGTTVVGNPLRVLRTDTLHDASVPLIAHRAD